MAERNASYVPVSKAFFGRCGPINPRLKTVAYGFRFLEGLTVPKLQPTANPKYCRHKSTGQAYVTLNGVEVYLGKYDSAESKKEYQRQIGQWNQSGRQLVRQ